VTCAEPITANLIPLEEALAHCGRPTRKTAIRWVKRGCRAPNGSIVKLQAWRVGGRWLTTREAVARWLSAVEAGSASEAARA
jgi:Protein of unknown function (DUF1580)